MSTKNKNLLLLIGALAAILLLFGLYLKTGTIHTPWSSVLGALFSNDVTNENHVVIQSFRLPRILMAFLAGSALSVAGMFMQNLFSNPLAGPDVLGITSGSSLLVALWMMTGFTLFGAYSDLIVLGIVGALMMGVLMLVLALKLRGNVHLLLTGLMLGSFVSALISVVEASAGAKEMQQFVFWNFGSLQRVTLQQIPYVFTCVLVGILLAYSQVRSMNAMVLGATSAKALGVSLKSFRVLSILTTGILTGTITAFTGPIAFVGLAIPNVAKMLCKTQNHRVLLLANVLLGALFLGLCDFAIVCLQPFIAIPLNALISLIGVPFIVWMIFKNRYVTS